MKGANRVSGEKLPVSAMLWSLVSTWFNSKLLIWGVYVHYVLPPGSTTANRKYSSQELWANVYLSTKWHSFLGKKEGHTVNNCHIVGPHLHCVSDILIVECLPLPLWHTLHSPSRSICGNPEVLTLLKGHHMQDRDLALGLETAPPTLWPFKRYEFENLFQSKDSKHRAKQTFTFHQTPWGLEIRVTLGQAKEHLVLWTIESFSLGQTSESRMAILSLPWKEYVWRRCEYSHKPDFWIYTQGKPTMTKIRKDAN